MMMKKEVKKKKRRDEQHHHNILQNCLPGVTISTSMTSSIRSSTAASASAADVDETAAAAFAAAGGVAAGRRSTTTTSRSDNYLPSSNYIISPTTSISSNDTSIMSMESSPLLMMPSPSSAQPPPSSSLFYVDIQHKTGDPSIHLMILEERERRQRHYTTKRYVQGGIFLLVLFVFATWNNNNNNNNNNGCTHNWCSGNTKETSSTPSVQQVAVVTTTTTKKTTNNDDYTTTTSSPLVSVLEDDNNNNRDEVLHILKNLDEEIDGDIVLESTKTKFIEATKVWQQYLPVPFVVIEPHTHNDVTKILPILTGLTRDYHIPFRIRSGGHNYAGYSTIDNSGIVLSLRNLNSTTIKPIINNATTTATTGTTILVEPGVTVEQFLQTTLADDSSSGDGAGGLGASSSSSVVADAAGVGMIGFVLGGGYNFMSRKYGLGIDNVVGFKVVLTNGTTLSVQHGDDDLLFWALRGSGGGNFGIVTEMEYQLHKMEDMKLAGHIKIPFVQLPQFLQKLGQHESKLDHNFVAMVRGYERYQQQQPQPQHSYIRLGGGDGFSDSNNTTTTTSVVRQSSSSTTSAGSMMMTENGTVSITFYWAGDADPDNPIGEDYIKKEIVPLLPKTEDDDDIASEEEEEVDYYYYSWSGTTRQKEQDKSLSTVYAAQSWNGFMFAENNTDIVWQDIRENLSVLFKYCTPYLKPKIELWGGAIAEAAVEQNKNDDNGTTTADRGGAFPYRQALFNVGIELYIPDGTDNAKQIFQQQSALIGAVWPSIAQYLQGVYVNFSMPSLTKEEYPKAYWGNNLERLQKLKDQYDPYHVLTYEQSIPTIKSDDNTNSSSSKADAQEGGGFNKLR